MYEPCNPTINILPHLRTSRIPDTYLENFKFLMNRVILKLF